MNLKRGEIYLINFPYTADPKYRNGKSKFVLVLQEGSYFKKYNTVTVLLLTSQEPPAKYPTNVEIPVGTTKLSKQTWIGCAQPYPVKKELFEANDVWCAGKLSAEKMDEVDEALYFGLCMGLQHDLESDAEEEPVA